MQSWAALQCRTVEHNAEESVAYIKHAILLQPVKHNSELVCLQCTVVNQDAVSLIGNDRHALML